MGLIYRSSPTKKPCRIFKINGSKHQGRGCKCCSNFSWNFRARELFAHSIGGSRCVHVLRSLPTIVVSIWVTNLGIHKARDACGLEKIACGPFNSVQSIWNLKGPSPWNFQTLIHSMPKLLLRMPLESWIWHCHQHHSIHLPNQPRDGMELSISLAIYKKIS